LQNIDTMNTPSIEFLKKTLYDVFLNNDYQNFEKTINNYLDSLGIKEFSDERFSKSYLGNTIFRSEF